MDIKLSVDTMKLFGPGRSHSYSLMRKEFGCSQRDRSNLL